MRRRKQGKVYKREVMRNIMSSRHGGGEPLRAPHTPNRSKMWRRGGGKRLTKVAI